MNLVPTRPQRIGETLDAGFRLYRKTFLKALPLAAVSALFSGIPSLVMPLADGMSSPAVFGGLMFVWFILFLFITPLTWGAIIALIDSYARDEPMPMGQALRIGVNRMFPMLGALIMYFLIISAASFLLLVPGIVLMFSMMFYMYALVLDRKGPIDSLGYSHSLVWGRWWRTLTLLSVPWAVAFTIIMLFQMPFPLLTSEPKMVMVLMQVGNMIGTAVVMPLLYAVMVICYYELKLRAEGDDLLARIDAEAVPA
jgi:hypothetical protein